VEEKHGAAVSGQISAARRLQRGRWVRPSTPEDGPAIVALMKAAGLQPHVDPGHLHWKYWRQRADWSGSRSFVVTDGRSLLAHGGAIPGTLRWEVNEARVIFMIDWAARRDAVGAGTVLMKHVGQMSDFLLGVGGSRHSLKIMPLIGYRHCGSVTGYVRTLAPLGILMRPCGSRWKLAPRVARSMVWSLSAPRADLAGWQARRIGVNELERVAGVLPQSSPGIALFGRAPVDLGHALACSIVPVELHALERAERPGGYFLLSYAPGQVRLADLWMDSRDPADWRALVHSAVERARRKAGAAELVAWSSDPALSRVLEECGFHERLTLPIYLRSSEDLAIPRETVRVQMLDTDAFYLYFGRNELWA
jgi:hypothetical protein